MKKNFGFFIAQKLIFGKEKSAKISAPVIRIAIAGVILGLSVMIVSMTIVNGFQKEIREKTISFNGNILISSFDANSSFEKKPIQKNNTELITALQSNKDIRHFQVFATKAAIIKTDENIEGVKLKGVGSDYDWTNIDRFIKEGKSFRVSDSVKSNEALISTYTARKLNLKCGDDLILYFVQQPPRLRKMKISGIYESGMEDIDKLFVLCDIAHIQKLNDWNVDEVAGYEVMLNEFDQTDRIATDLNSKIGYSLNAQSIREQNPQLFDWLGLQDLNAEIIIALILIVCVMNMISALLIIILENSSTIGILKSLGANNALIRRIFLLVALCLVSAGIFAGNILGLLFCFFQKQTAFFRLDQESYYIPYVPINLAFSNLLLLNAGIILVCFLFLILPTFFVSRIKPVESIRFS